VLAAVCCAGAGVHAAEPTKKEVQPMTSKQEQAARLLELPDGDYFAFGQDLQTKLVDALRALSNAADKAPAPLLALGAPRRVQLGEQRDVPVLVGRVQSGLRAWQVNPVTNLHLLARNLATGELSVAQPLKSMRRADQELASGKGTPPDSVTAATVYTSVEAHNLQEKLEVPLAQGTFAITAIVNELHSNTVQMRIESSKPAPAVAKPPAPQNYVRHRLEARPMPSTVVQVPQSASGREEIAVRVAVQVSEDAGVLQSSSAQPVWPSHVILVKLDERPQVIPVVVPVQRIGSPPKSYNAVFQVDLRAAVKAPLSGAYQVYVDVGRGLLGPYPLTVAQ
jgi:hypothetical protein